jgi:DNA-binding response OmpR family regulator
MAMPVQKSLPAWAEEPSVLQKSYHILVVDDEASIVRLLQENLQLEGYQVTCAYDGQAALRLVQNYCFDLIILDVNMPMTNGLKVFETLRNGAKTAQIPVIFVTGEPSKDVYPAIADAARVAHLKKPLELESFNSLVRLFLERYPTS